MFYFYAVFSQFILLGHYNSISLYFLALSSIGFAPCSYSLCQIGLTVMLYKCVDKILA